MALPRLLKRAVKIFIGVLVSFLVFIFLINSAPFDEELDPEIVESLNLPQMPPASQNAYVALWGMPGADKLDMLEVGEHILERHDEKVSLNKDTHSLSTEDFQEIYQALDLDKSWTEGYERCTPRVEYGCLERLRSHVQKIGNNDRFKLVTERYYRILEMPYFQERYWDSYHDTVPQYGILMHVSNLELATLYFKQSTQFLNILEKDMIFWRSVLDAENSLVTKMVSIASLWKNALFLSEYMLNEDLSESDVVQIKSILEPLTSSELNIEEAWKFERYPFMASESFDEAIYFEMFDGMEKGSLLKWLTSSLIQKNATKNMTYRNHWKPLIYYSGLSANELNEVLSKVKTEESLFECCGADSLEKLNSFSVSNLYNLVGKLDFKNMNWSSVDYLKRVHDLGGIINLVNIQLEIEKSTDVDPKVIVKNSMFKNPFTLKTMEIDPNNKMLSFECQGVANKCQIRF